MSHLVAPVQTSLVDRAYNALSSLVAEDSNELVAIRANVLATSIGADVTDVVSLGGNIAALCTTKFSAGPQSAFYTWHVIYVSERRCFVAMSESLVSH